MSIKVALANDDNNHVTACPDRIEPFDELLGFGVAFTWEDLIGVREGRGDFGAEVRPGAWMLLDDVLSAGYGEGDVGVEAGTVKGCGCGHRWGLVSPRFCGSQGGREATRVSRVAVIGG